MRSLLFAPSASGWCLPGAAFGVLLPGEGFLGCCHVGWAGVSLCLAPADDPCVCCETEKSL